MKIILHKNPVEIRFLDDDGNEIGNELAVHSLSISASVDQLTKVVLDVCLNADLSQLRLEGCEIQIPPDVITVRRHNEVPFSELTVGVAEIREANKVRLSKTQIALSVLLIVAITVLAVMSWCP
jgi:hypothetical protein